VGRALGTYRRLSRRYLRDHVRIACSSAPLQLDLASGFGRPFPRIREAAWHGHGARVGVGGAWRCWSAADGRGRIATVTRWVVPVLGVLLVVLGGLWTLQGLGLVGGSFMTGSRLWLVIGLVLVIAGAALLLRRRRRA
jgi:LPXTG-motif cell wall-anchored protein